MQGIQDRSLIRELRSHMLCCAIKNFFKKNDFCPWVLSHCHLSSIEKEIEGNDIKAWNHHLLYSCTVRRYKEHKNNLTNELIPTSLSLSWFSDLGGLSWEKTARLFRHMQESTSASAFQYLKVVWSCLTYLELTDWMLAAWGPCWCQSESPVHHPPPSPEPSSVPDTWWKPKVCWINKTTQSLLTWVPVCWLCHFQLFMEAESQSHHL